MERYNKQTPYQKVGSFISTTDVHTKRVTSPLVIVGSIFHLCHPTSPMYETPADTISN
jgi:hypothetical protein